MISNFEAGDRERRELESLAAGMKAVATWHSIDTIQQCRECCGGAGYLSVNRFAALKADVDVFTTFEGDNTVLILLAARGLLTDYAHDFGGLGPAEMVSFVAGQAVETIISRLSARKIGQAITDAVPTHSASENWLDRDHQLDLFKWRESNIVASVANRFRRGLSDGYDAFEVFRAVADHAVDAARAHVELVVLTAFIQAIEDCDNAQVKHALNLVCDLYALTQHRGRYRLLPDPGARHGGPLQVAASRGQPPLQQGHGALRAARRRLRDPRRDRARADRAARRGFSRRAALRRCAAAAPGNLPVTGSMRVGGGEAGATSGVVAVLARSSSWPYRDWRERPALASAVDAPLAWAVVSRLTRIIVALCAVAASGGALSVVGAYAAGGTPTAVPQGGAVASVNGVAITRSTFNHWMVIAADSAAASPTGQLMKQPVPIPPHYAACIAALRRQLKAVLKGKRQPTATQLRSQCAAEYRAYLQQVMQFLISSAWVLGEAGSEGISVSSEKVVSTFLMIKKQQFPTEAAYRAFRASSAETLADLLLRVKLELLSTALRQKVIAGASPVTDAQVASFYGEHKNQFRVPQRLNASVILTRTRAQALAALRAISSGTTFATEARRVSIDRATRDRGGALVDVVRSRARALVRALFAAPPRTLEGPLATPLGYYVFTVTQITESTQESLQQVSAGIRLLLAGHAQQLALSEWVSSFTQRWTARTTCSPGFVVQDCEGYHAKPPTLAANAGRS